MTIHERGDAFGVAEVVGRDLGAGNGDAKRGIEIGNEHDDVKRVEQAVREVVGGAAVVGLRADSHKDFFNIFN